MRRFLAVVVVFVALLGSFGGVGLRSRVAEASPTKPNILIILTDDQREGLGVMPATSQLFKQGGVEYRGGYVTTPLCCPSRSSIMTGRYAHNTKVRSNGIHSDFGVEDWRALDLSTTIQHYLSRSGYTTAIFGKFLNGWPLKHPPPDFDEWAIDRRGYRDQPYNIGSKRSDPSGTVQTISTYNSTFVGDRAVSFINGHDGNKPWYLYVAPSAPHAPFTPQKKYADDTFGRWPGNAATQETDRSDKPPYVQGSSATLSDGRHTRTKQFRTLESVDDQVRAIFQALQKSGQADNTLAFFLSDNGYMWGEHGLLKKDFPYPQSVEVPLLARWPGHLPAGVVDRRGAANIDLAPTIMEATGTSPPRGAPMMDGRSLLGDWSRSEGFTEHWCNRRCNFWASVTNSHYQYTEYYNGSDFTTAAVTFREYYDLDNDPWELTNLLNDGDPSNDPPTGPLHSTLMADSQCSGAACP